jgi:protein-arginine kinase activator protein McsA
VQLLQTLQKSTFPSHSHSHSHSHSLSELKCDIIFWFRHTIVTILQFAKQYAKDRGDKQLASKVKQCFENFKKLEEKGMLNKADNYTQFLRDVALVQELVNSISNVRKQK